MNTIESVRLGPESISEALAHDLPETALSSDGGGESRPAGTTASLDRGGGPAQVKTASEVSAPEQSGRALDGSGASPLSAQVEPKVRPLVVNGDIAGVATGPSDIVSETNDVARIDAVPDASQIAAPVAGDAPTSFDGLPDIPELLDRRNRSAA